MLDTLLTHLRTCAPDPVDIPVLQPADPFLETAGEDMRRRIFMTQDTTGAARCLRPEFTIPICLAHLESEAASARYAYGGTVFRQARAGASEFLQAGLEDLGNRDIAAADADALADMLDALQVCGVGDVDVTLGDQNLFGIVVKSLSLPTAIAARLVRNFGSPGHMEALLDGLASPMPAVRCDGEADTLARSGDEAGLVAHIERLMEEAGLSPKSGRSPQDIARRMIEKMREADFRLSQNGAEQLRNFLAIETPLPQAVDHLSLFADAAGFDFAAAVEVFEKRLEALYARGVDLSRLTYNAAFGRKLDYYTGVLFEATQGGVTIAGGGRYDDLCTLLGSATPVPAVGFSISLDRVDEVLAPEATQ